MQEPHSFTPAPEYEEAERALARRLSYAQWPGVLKVAHQRKTASDTSVALRHQLYIGAMVAAITLIWDYIVLPTHFEVSLIWRLATIGPLTWAGLHMLSKGKLQWAKLATATSVICLALMAMYLASFGDEALMTRYCMAIAFLLGVACFALPFTAQELRTFALAYIVLTGIAAMWPSPLEPVAVATHVGFTMLVGGSSVALRQSYWEIDARSFLKDLREEATLEQLEYSNMMLRQLAEEDPLTGLSNRRYFEGVLTERLGSLPGKQTSGHLIGLMMIDLDHFKTFNDRHGHLAGDKCLKLVAQALQSIFPKDYGVLARFGGEEFIAAIRERQPGEVTQLAAEMRAEIESLFDPAQDGAEPLITASIGVALAPAESGLVIEDLIEMADVALYSAKNAGRNRVEVIEAGSQKRNVA